MEAGRWPFSAVVNFAIHKVATGWRLTLLIWSTVMTVDTQRRFSNSRTILNVFSPLDSRTMTRAF